VNFLKRAATSITRRLGKTVILLLLILLLGTVISGAISVSGAINNTDANLRRRMRPIVSIGFDWNGWNLYHGFDQEAFDWNAFDPDDPVTHPPEVPKPPSITPEYVRAIGALDYINFYDSVIQSWMWSFELDIYGSHQFPAPPGVPEGFQLRGTSRTELAQISQGAIDLISGRQFNEEELIYRSDSQQSAAIISEGFANLNDLTLGSTFRVYRFVRFPDEYGNPGGFITSGFFDDEHVYARIEMELEVIGLFDVSYDAQNPEIAPWIRGREMNAIYVPNWIIESTDYRTQLAERSVWEYVDREMPEWLLDQIEQWNSDDVLVEAVFVLENPAHLEDFREIAAPLLPSEFHYFDDLFSEFDEIATAMTALQNVGNWVLYGSIGATLLILGLLTTLFLHDRRHEIGIYLALGEKKVKIILQVLAEVMLVTVVGITFAVFTGNQISGIVSQNILENELLELSSERNFFNNFDEHTIFDRIGFPPRNNLSPEEMIEAFDVSLNTQAITLFYAVGIGTVMVSTLAPVVYVVMLKPKEVLL